MRLRVFRFGELFGPGTASVGMMVWMAASFGCSPVAFADAITLGSAQSFAVLGGAGVSVGGACSAPPACTIVSGNLGDSPLALSSITGFEPPSTEPGMLVNGSFFASDSSGGTAAQAQTDENTAYNALVALPAGVNESGVTLGTGGAVSSLMPGTYTFSSSAQIDGTLTLNFSGASNEVFVFQIGSTLTTGTSAAIDVTGGNSSDAIYWQVGQSATLGSSTDFAGNILALDAITLDPSASIVCGRALAYTDSVTMAGTNFVSDNCSTQNTTTGFSAGGPTDFGSVGFSGSTPASGTPEPATFLLLGFGLAAMAVKRSTRRT